MNKLKPQFCMWSGERQMLLAKHDFFVEQVKYRILRNFDNLKEEAGREAEELYELIGRSYSDGHDDMSTAAETAMEHGIEFYELLSDLKMQTTLGALASLFHQWDKDLRGFVERELSHTHNADSVAKFCWHTNIGKIFDLLTEFGWEIRSTEFFPLINACRLIVNVFKHGKGQSLDDLFAQYPQYLKGPFGGIDDAPWLSAPNHENLSITEEEFDQLAAALREFWVTFPEHLALVGAEPS